MGEDFVFKMVVIKPRGANHGWKMADLEFYVGPTQPPATPLPFDKTNYQLCGKLPYQMPGRAGVGPITCTKWTIGRVGVVQNNQLDNSLGTGDAALMLNQVGVYGFYFSDLGVQV